MNSVQLTGRLTRDPEIRYTDGGSTVASYTVAVDRRYRQEGGETADFIRCVSFGKSAEFMEKYFRQGMKIEINGRIQTGSYINKDGQKVYTTNVITEQIGFAESKRSSEAEGNGYERNNERPRPSDADGFMNIPDGVEDEGLPFN